jgi:hypothetical protein
VLATDFLKHAMSKTVKAKMFTAMDMTEHSLLGNDRM